MSTWTSYLGMQIQVNLVLKKDFNIDLLKQETHVGKKCFLNCMYDLGLYPLIERPS